MSSSLKKLESISTFCQTLAAPFQSRIHSSTWDDYVGGHLLQGPPHLSSISLAKQVGPLLLGAQGSSPRNGLGPLLCNMSDKWNILRPFRLFFGHEHGRSLLLVRTACGTMKKKSNLKQIGREFVSIRWPLKLELHWKKFRKFGFLAVHAVQPQLQRGKENWTRKETRRSSHLPLLSYLPNILQVTYPLFT